MQTPTQQRNHTRVVALTAPAGGLAAVTPISESLARLLGVAGVLAIGVIHILDAAATYQSTRWIFWSYIALIAAAVPVALALLHWNSPLAWVAAAGLALNPLAGYLLSRTIGLPGDAPDVGNWLCTLGMAALFAEAWVLGLSIVRFGALRR